MVSPWTGVRRALSWAVKSPGGTVAVGTAVASSLWLLNNNSTGDTGNKLLRTMRLSHNTDALGNRPRNVLALSTQSSSGSETSATINPSQGLKFLAGASIIPHPSKEDKGGEDAYYISDDGRSLGVADGVGGWAEIGVDPGLYSRELMEHAKEFAAKLFTNDRNNGGDPSNDDGSSMETNGAQPSAEDYPQKILKYAHDNTKARGSCTACIICIQDSKLYASNLGDSGFLLIRNKEPFFVSPQQQHEFNFPYQLGSADSMADSPSSAQNFTVEVQQGDIVVAATDGVFDNVYPDEAASIVALSHEQGDSAKNAAVSLAQFSRMRAGDPTHLSPFAYGAQQLGYRYFGGKMDDITVVVGYIVDNNNGDRGVVGGKDGN